MTNHKVTSAATNLTTAAGLSDTKDFVVQNVGGDPAWLAEVDDGAGLPEVGFLLAVGAVPREIRQRAGSNWHVWSAGRGSRIVV